MSWFVPGWPLMPCLAWSPPGLTPQKFGHSASCPQRPVTKFRHAARGGGAGGAAVIGGRVVGGGRGLPGRPEWGRGRALGR
jgi:hypothetical protein